MIKSKVCLVIIDGWGIGRNDFTNPIYLMGTPYLDSLKQNYPYASLQTSGLASGLSYLEEGSSEVGHLIIGAGRVVYQAKSKIDLSINNSTFLKNPVLLNTINHVKSNNSNLHLLGLLSSSETMASFNHLLSLIYLAKINGISNIYLDLILDGKDGPSFEAIELIQKLKDQSSKLGSININTISGRFYALNEQNNMYLDKYFDLLTHNSGHKTDLTSLNKLFLDQKEKNITNEFSEPTIINGYQPIQNNDGLIVFNLRPNHFPIEYLINKLKTKPTGPNNLMISSFVSFNSLDKSNIAFIQDTIKDSLCEVLYQNQKRQVHLSESFKSLHVTYYFDGLNRNPFPGEYWLILPSKDSLNFKDNPYLEMPNITERAFQAFSEGVYDFILINYPNADLVAHTGNIDLAKTVVNMVDNELKKLITQGLSDGYTFIITSDHGNIEQMKDPFTGETTYDHDESFVPFYLVGNDYKLTEARTVTQLQNIERKASGVLADIAPTILEIFQIKQPILMTGHSLLSNIIPKQNEQQNYSSN